MNSQQFSKPLDLKNIRMVDSFWQREMELVRTRVLPYQWKALNDEIPNAEPSYCMHNFRAAARLMQKRRLEGKSARSKFTLEGFQQLPEDKRKPDLEHFYGFVFQDTDFSKWIEAVSYSLVRHPDKELEKIADKAIDVVCAAQAEDGYLDTCYILSDMDQRFTNLRDHHELYCLGHLIEGAVAYYQATGKDKLLRAARRFADCVCERFGVEEGKCHGYPGHEIVEMALVRLYDVTGEERYLTLSRYFIDQRGQAPHYFAMEENARRKANGESELPIQPERFAYHQADKPVREQSEAQGHAVRAMYLYAGMADVARLTQDEALLDACKRLWHSAVDEKMYITGGIGSTRLGEAFTYPFDLPNDAAYSETCAAIGLVFFARRMLQMEADSRYADVMERALYNTVLAGMALDGKSFFYVNPLEVVPSSAHRDERLSHITPRRQKWFGCACCPPNIARMVSSLGAYVCTVSDDTIYTHLYVAGDYRCTLGGKKVTLHLRSEMPWCEKAKAVVELLEADDTNGVYGTLAFRLPGWCDCPNVISDGKTKEVKNGYVYLTGIWHTGDAVRVRMPMRVKMMKARGEVRENDGMIAFTYGPLVFCAEEYDNGSALHQICIDPMQVRKQRVLKCEDDTFGHKTLRLSVPALRECPTEDASLYQEWRPDTLTPVTLTLIPYYCWANRGKAPDAPTDEGEMRVWFRTTKV